MPGPTPLKETLVRRLLVLPAILSALAFAPAASADDVPCHGVHSGSTEVGVCAGIICVDICAPQPVVHGQCSGVPTIVLALCSFRFEP